MIIIGQISLQSLTTHSVFFQFTLTLLSEVFVSNKSGLKQNVTETSLILFVSVSLAMDNQRKLLFGREQ